MIDTSYAMLFDFDGTLMDTEQAILSSFEEIFRRYRTVEEYTDQRRVEVLGPSLYESMTKYFPEQDPKKLEEEYRAYQKEHLHETVKPMEHSVELVDTLRSKGYKVGLVSTRRHDSMQHILNMLSLSDKFDILVGFEDVKKGKPAPDGILLACEKLGCDKCVYVGDSVTDIQAGKAANAITVGYISNIHKKEALIASTPDYITDELLDVLKILK